MGTQNQDKMTQQERAAVLLDRIIGIIPIQPSQREARIEWLVEYAVETRRAALLEARKAVVSEYLQDPVEDDPGDIAYDHAIRDAVEAIDRLAQEGA